MDLRSINKLTIGVCGCALCLQLVGPLVAHNAPVGLATSELHERLLLLPDSVHPRASALQMLQRGIVGSTNYEVGIMKMNDHLTGSSFSVVANYLSILPYANTSTTVSAY